MCITAEPADLPLQSVLQVPLRRVAILERRGDLGRRIKRPASKPGWARPLLRFRTLPRDGLFRRRVDDNRGPGFRWQLWGSRASGHAPIISWANTVRGFRQSCAPEQDLHVSVGLRCRHLRRQSPPAPLPAGHLWRQVGCSPSRRRSLLWPASRRGMLLCAPQRCHTLDLAPLEPRHYKAGPWLGRCLRGVPLRHLHQPASACADGGQCCHVRPGCRHGVAVAAHHHPGLRRDRRVHVRALDDAMDERLQWDERRRAAHHTRSGEPIDAARTALRVRLWRQ